MDLNQKIFPRRNFFAWTILLSLALHACFLWWKLRESRIAIQQERENTPVEISRVPPNVPPRPQRAVPPSKAVEMAQTEDARNRDVDPNAKVLSDHTQTAKDQTRAKAIDDFRKKQGTGANSRSKPDKLAFIPPTGSEQPSAASKPTELGDGTEAPKQNQEEKNAGVKRDWKTLSLKDLSVGDGAPSAASDDRLSDVQTGDQTILSTREYRYFSYYNRIKELLRQYWKPNVEHRLYKMWASGKAIGDDEITTKLLVLLNDAGQIQKISRVGSSGFVELDQAAIEAFQKAGPFPNPPKGIVESDGFVRIRWDFILKTEATPRIQFRNVGNAR